MQIFCSWPASSALPPRQAVSGHRRRHPPLRRLPTRQAATIVLGHRHRAGEAFPRTECPVAWYDWSGDAPGKNAVIRFMPVDGASIDTVDRDHPGPSVPGRRDDDIHHRSAPG
ncbi:MAG: hypothetical protein RJR34_12475 [Candidatus Methanoculleus thermohydrogenotrophicum]|nr:hypothetical protein [Candidatus Methanoculleus thermohydrogenotrophicum]